MNGMKKHSNFSLKLDDRIAKRKIYLGQYKKTYESFDLEELLCIENCF